MHVEVPTFKGLYKTTNPAVVAKVASQQVANLYPGIAQKDGIILSLSTVPTMEKSKEILCANKQDTKLIAAALDKIHNRHLSDGVGMIKELLSRASNIK